MTLYETSQLELAAVLFTVTAAPLACLVRWLVRRHRWPATPTLCMAFIVSLGAAAFALADSENGKPDAPQVLRWMRLKREWVCWTHTVKNEWAEFCAAVRQGFISMQGLYGEVLDITNSLPADAVAPPAMQLRVNLVDSQRNQNFKARPTGLWDNGDGTRTVEITSSREISDAPTTMMYLRRRSDGAAWWVEHTSSSFPENSSPNAYTYTFQMPVDVEGHLAVADEVLLGGPGGLTVEGLVLVDLDKGCIYEGVNGHYIMGDGRIVQVKGGVFMFDGAKAQSTEGPEPEPMARQAAAEPAPRDAVILRDPVTAAKPGPVPEPVPEPAAPPLKLAMPPLDGGAR